MAIHKKRDRTKIMAAFGKDRDRRSAKCKPELNRLMSKAEQSDFRDEVALAEVNRQRARRNLEPVDKIEDADID